MLIWLFIYSANIKTMNHYAIENNYRIKSKNCRSMWHAYCLLIGHRRCHNVDAFWWTPKEVFKMKMDKRGVHNDWAKDSGKREPANGTLGNGLYGFSYGHGCNLRSVVCQRLNCSFNKIDELTASFCRIRSWMEGPCPLWPEGIVRR